MMSFCKNTLHTFLGFSPTPSKHHSDTRSPPPIAGLITITENSSHKPPANVLESASLKPSSISTTITSATKQDSRCSGSGSLDEITTGNGVSINYGLSSCTESLGFESSEQMEEMIHESSSRSLKLRMNANNNTTSTSIDCRKTKDGVNQIFPPLLSSLRRNDGQNSTSFLKQVRENGRLVLTQVTISRPEVFHVSRQDGRLRLQFINQEEEKEICGGVEWKIPAASGGGGGEGLKRCHEMNLHHHHHRSHHHNHMQHWNQQPQCVTSR